MLKLISAALAGGCAYLASTVSASADPISIGSFIISAFLSSGLGALLPTASAALIGNVVLGAAVVGSMLIQSALMKRPSIQPEKFKNVFRGDNDTSEIRAVGRVRVGGLVAFGNTKGKNRYRMICHTRGLWTGTEEHYLGGREVVVDDDGAVSSPPWANIDGTNVTILSKLGTGSETAWTALMSEFPDLWTPAHMVRGIHQSLVKYVSPGFDSEDAIKRHQLLFQGGEPPYEKVGRAEPVFDPRSGQSPTNANTWEWGENGALNAAHILRSFPSIRHTDLDYGSIAAEADKADTAVAKLGGQEPRARAWGFWTSESARGDIMDQVLSSIGAEIVPTDDQRYTIRLVDDNPPVDIKFFEQHVIDIDYASGPESVQRPNICRIKYYSPERNFDFADIDLSNAPWARVQAEIDRVGEQIETIELPFCPSAAQAQRVGRRLFALKRADAGLAKLNYAGVAAWGCTIAELPFPHVGEDGATVWKKCAIGSPRINDEDGTVELPFVVWPDLSPWNPATMEVPAPEAIPDLQYPSDLDTPAIPAGVAVVQYPGGGAYEVRMQFTGVTDGTVAEANFRPYIDDLPDPWQAMTEYQGGGLWYAWATADARPRADFRVRFFNEEGEASYFSDVLSAPSLAISNATPPLPTVNAVVTDDGSGGITAIDLKITTPQLRVVKTQIERSLDGGAWSTVSTLNDMRPNVERTVPLVVPPALPTEPQTLQWRVSSFTSNDTQGGYATGSVIIPETGGT